MNTKQGSVIILAALFFLFFQVRQANAFSLTEFINNLLTRNQPVLEKSSLGAAAIDSVSGADNTTPVTYPAGCNASTPFSTTTGQACNGSGVTLPSLIAPLSKSTILPVPVLKIVPPPSSSSLPDGCLLASGYSTTTGQACGPMTPPVLTITDPGCSSSENFSTTTGQPCPKLVVTPPVSTPTDLGCNGSAFSTTTGQPCVSSTAPTNPADKPVQDCTASFFTKTLQLGQRNGQVEALQAILVDAGYLVANSTTGYFGSKTKAALKAFEKANKVSTTGYTGPSVRTKLNEIWKQECVTTTTASSQ